LKRLRGRPLSRCALGGVARIDVGAGQQEPQLRHEKNADRIAFPDREWADWDRGALVWAEEGKLCA
jgi:hypothetical protein